MSSEASPKLVYFCHGIPGSAQDGAFLKAGLPADTVFIAPNLLEAQGEPGESFPQQFDELTAGFASAQIHVVGFSIGTMAAVHIAQARGERVGLLSLISVAAPLCLGDFLANTAGAPVFKLARSYPVLLRVVIGLQGLVFRFRADLLMKALFAKCGLVERHLVEKPEITERLLSGLENSLLTNPRSYSATLQAYVRDWSAVLSDIKCKTELWHGSEDTWSPPDMAYALQKELPADTQLHIVDGGEHYSTLQAYGDMLRYGRGADEGESDRTGGSLCLCRQ